MFPSSLQPLLCFACLLSMASISLGSKFRMFFSSISFLWCPFIHISSNSSYLKTSSESACLAWASFLSVRWACVPILRQVFHWHFKGTIPNWTLYPLYLVNGTHSYLRHLPLWVLLKPPLSTAKSCQVPESLTHVSLSHSVHLCLVRDWVWIVPLLDLCNAPFLMISSALICPAQCTKSILETLAEMLSWCFL